jgi:hypothetical protein
VDVAGPESSVALRSFSAHRLPVDGRRPRDSSLKLPRAIRLPISKSVSEIMKGANSEGMEQSMASKKAVGFDFWGTGFVNNWLSNLWNMM